MLTTLKNLLGLGPRVNYAELISNGAIIMDVRTLGEYKSGHIKGSMNIPLNQLSGQLSKFKNKETPILTCCASGARSGAAVSVLRKAGFQQVHNAGAWTSLRRHVSQ